MSDPLDVLSSSPRRTEPDPMFRARVLAEVAKALDDDTSMQAAATRAPGPSPRSYGTVAADVALPGFWRRNGARPLAFALAGAAAAITLVIALVAGGGTRSEPPAQQPNSTVAALPALPASTVRDPTQPDVTQPATTQPATTQPATAAPTTTIGAAVTGGLTDDEIAKAVLLAAEEYAPGFELTAFKHTALDGAIAATIPGCAAFVDTVFESERRPATVRERWFYTDLPAVMGQYAVVLASDQAAEAMFAGLQDPAFASGCLGQYVATVSAGTDGRCCNIDETATPALFGQAVESSLTLGADEIALRTSTEYWTDANFVEHGPETLVSATIRVGRVVVTLEAITLDEHGQPVITEDQFHAALATVAARAREALAS